MASGSKGKGRIYSAGWIYKKRKRANRGVNKIKGGYDQIESRKESAEIQGRYPKAWKRNRSTETEDWLFKDCCAEEGHWWKLCQQVQRHKKRPWSGRTSNLIYQRTCHECKQLLCDRWCKTGEGMRDVPFGGDVCCISPLCSSGGLYNMQWPPWETGNERLSFLQEPHPAAYFCALCPHLSFIYLSDLSVLNNVYGIPCNE